MIEQIDFLVRVVAIGAALMLIAQIAAGEMRETVKYPLVALSVGAVAYLIQSNAMLMTEGPLKPWVDLVAIATPFWIWLFARRLFGREPERRIALVALAVLLTGWVLAHFVPLTGEAGFALHQIAGLALIGDVVRIGMKQSKHEPGADPAVRKALPLAIGALAGVILLAGSIGEVTGLYPGAELTIAVLVLLMTLFAGLALLRTHPELLLETEPAESEPVEDDDVSAAPDSGTESA